MDQSPPAQETHDWRSDYLLWIPLLIISWRLAWKFQDPFISDWDGFDYTIYSVKNLPSALGLSRALFLGFNHLLWQIAHRLFEVPLESAYLVFRYSVIAQSGPAVVGIYALCKELTASRLAAAAGALIVAASPFYITYSGRVMSEIPAFLMLSWSLWWMFRSLRLGRTKSFLFAALLVGASANIREFAVFYLWIVPVAAYISGRRWRLCILAFAVAVFGALLGPLFWTLYSYDYYVPAVINWYRLSAQERRIHNATAANFYFLRTFSYQCSVAATLIAPFAIAFLARRRGLYGLKLLAAAGFLADVVMLINHDLVVNPRYLLTGLLGLAAVSGWAIAELAKWRPEVAGGVALLVAGLSIGVFIQLGKENYDQLWNARAARRYLSRIEFLPGNTVFIAGARTPLVNFYVGLGARPEWKTIQPGSGWPDERLGGVIDKYLAEGRPVYVDFDKDLWQLGSRETAREWVGLEMIRNHYQLDHIHDEFYRIVRRQRS
jgi:hypothetical protein